MRLWWALCLASSGCLFGSGGHKPPPDPGDPVMVVAVGANVTPRLDRCPSYGDVLCIESPGDDIARVTVDSNDVFQIGAPYVDENGDWRLRLTALRAGDATLTFEISHPIDTELVHVKVRALDVTHASFSATCEGSTLLSSDVSTIGIAVGLSFRFETVAWHDDTYLMSGDLELVERADGFTLTPPGSDREATSPTTAGTFTWQLVGDRVTTFVVYEQGALEPTLTSKSPGTVTLGRKIGDAIVCKHGRKERGLVEVTAGTCLPATDYAEVIGPMPVEIGTDTFTFDLASDIAQNCTVTARIESSGSTTSVAFDVEAPPPPPAPGPAIGTTPEILSQPTFAAGSDCGTALTDGDCDGVLEYPPAVDADCYIDSDWAYTHVENLSSTPSVEIDDKTEYTGVGLTTLVKATVTTDLLGVLPVGVGPPRNLVYSAPAEVDVQDLQCHSGEHVLAFKPTASNTSGHAITMTADNLDDTGTYRLPTRSISKVEFGGQVAGSYQVIAGSVVDVSPEYFSGTYALRGAAPVTVVANSGSASRSGSKIYMHTEGASVTVSATAAPSVGTLNLYATGPSSIYTIGNFNFNEYTTVGLQICTRLTPMSSGNMEILGNVGKPRVRFSGSSFVMGFGLTGQFCVRGYSPGATSIILTWGGATATRLWQVM